jgi:hypothetical protein
VKVTFEYKTSSDPDARYERLMDIIRRDFERRAFIRDATKVRVSLVPTPPSREVALAT